MKKKKKIFPMAGSRGLQRKVPGQEPVVLMPGNEQQTQTRHREVIQNRYKV